MSPIVRLVQWHNRACPWHQHKASLAKRAARFLPRAADGGGTVRVDGVFGGLTLELDPTSDYERNVALNAYEPVVVEIMRKVLQPGDTFIDGGANLGILTLIGATLVGPAGRVYAFEPQAAMAQRVRTHLALNRITHVVLTEKGVWETSGTKTLYEFENDTSEGVSMGRRADKPVAREFTIETTRIEDVAPPPVRLIKLDVEGAELPALRGCEKLLPPYSPGHHAPHIIAELKTVTSRAFGYDGIELVDFLLHKHPYRLHLVKTRKRQRTTRDDLAALLRDEPGKTHNVWFEPAPAR